MSYTNEDILAKALLIGGNSISEESERVLASVCEAAAEELKATLRRGVSPESLGETFVTAAGMLALALCMELENSSATDISSFKAGNISASLGAGSGSSAAALRKTAEGLLSAYLDRGGFGFMGVRG